MGGAAFDGWLAEGLEGCTALLVEVCNKDGNKTHGKEVPLKTLQMVRKHGDVIGDRC